MNPTIINKKRLNDTKKSGVDPARIKILVTAGSSGGHIFPALAFLDTLKARYKDADIFFLLPERSKIEKIENADYKIKYIPLPSFNFDIKLKNIRSILDLFRGYWGSLLILLKFQPDMVIGFGSLASVPAILFAWLLRIRTLIHEQNVVPGRANRLLALFTDKVAVSFAQTQDYFDNCKNKVVLTGNPLRKNLVRLDKFEALDFFGFERDKLTMLVTGGSQGSQRINAGFLNSICALKNKSDLQIIHLSGRKDYGLLKQRYESMGIKFALFSFLDSMQYAYSACDIILSRAGATSVAEIMFFELPAIFVPYPYAYRHQYKNAETLREAGCAIILEDEELNSGILKEKLDFLLKRRNDLENMRAGYSKFAKLNSADLLVDEAMSE